MEKIKVYIQYPWKFPDSPYYKYLVLSPPKNVNYLNAESQGKIITNKRKFWLLTRLKVNIRRWTNLLNLPIINSWKTKSAEKYSLIHCAHCLSKNDSPWVADMESVWSMWVSGMNTKIGRNKVRKILLDKNCKKIMPWTEHTKKEILKIFPEVEDKLEVIYPAVPLERKLPLKLSENITITFIGRDFRLKGGKIALETMKKIKKNNPSWRMIFISSLNEEIKKNNSEIELYDLLPHKEIKKILSETNIFLYPSLMDTFGFSVLEAMSYGVPTIALKTNLTPSIEEIISPEITGKIVPTECTIDDQSLDKINKTAKVIEKEIYYLVKDKKKLEEMSLNCIQEVKEGKFSLKRRNDKLRKIYIEAIK
jgi:glycosyltransferase involved in cell wall biosynthesis